VIQRRVAATVVVGAILLVIGGLVRPRSAATGIPQGQFWATKLSLPARFDVVVAGCSRVYRAVSPAAMQEVLPGRRIVNFGFSGLAYGPEYLAAVERLLAPDSPRPVVVLSIQPVNFLESFSRKNGFTDERRRDVVSRWLARHFGTAVQFLMPWGIDDSRQSIRPSGVVYYEVYHPDGWVASRKVPESPGEYLKSSAMVFAREQVSTRIEGELFSTVGRWVAKGVVVIGVRLPTSPEMRELEDRASGFDESTFARRFAKEGGVYLSYPPGKYHSYDGSHLRADSAVVFSRDLAQAIRPLVLRERRAEGPGRLPMPSGPSSANVAS